jgi:hypothetical protein
VVFVIIALFLSCVTFGDVAISQANSDLAVSLNAKNCLRFPQAEDFLPRPPGKLKALFIDL